MGKKKSSLRQQYLYDDGLEEGNETELVTPVDAKDSADLERIEERAVSKEGTKVTSSEKQKPQQQ